VPGLESPWLQSRAPNFAHVFAQRQRESAKVPCFHLGHYRIKVTNNRV
jgi:hypothetical protein